MTPLNDRPSKHAHQLVYETAVAMAHELYATLMSDNKWYHLWKRQNPEIESAKELELAFVQSNVSVLLPQARATLGAMLGRSSTDPLLKESIYDALLLDATLVRGRAN